MRSRGRRRWAVMLVGYVVLIGVIGLWTTAIDAPVRAQLDAGLAWLAERGVRGVRYGHVEALANLCLFLPLGLLVAGAVPDGLWWLGALAGASLSGAIEGAQMGIANRTASIHDVALNTVGAFAGAVLFHLLATRRSRARYPSR